jgi:glycosyltransferase involved in cell wall biosynthesis
MTKVIFAIPGDLATETGGYAYDRRMLKLLPSFGIDVSHLVLPGTFPNPTASDLIETTRRLAATPPDAKLIIDGLALGAMPADLVKGLKRRIIGLVHHPLALEAGLSDQRKRELAASETAALAYCQHVIVTSPMTGRILAADFGVPSERITVAEPGTDPSPRATGTGTPMQLLSVGAVSQRKGYTVLVEALKPLADLDWRLVIVGALDRDAGAVEALRQAIDANRGLRDRITLAGAVVPATLEKHYASADIFVLPSLFEGYGMVLAEAMSRGLPIICTTGGAAAETVPDDAAIKVPPGDVAALGAGLVRLMSDRKLRKRLEAASWNAGRMLPTWNETARRIFAAIMEMKA